MFSFLMHLLRRSVNAPFTLSGRRNRTDYIVYQILLFVLVAVMWLIYYGLDVFGTPFLIQWIFLFPLIVVYLGAIISVFVAGAQRYRDIGWPGWAVFLTIIPLAGYVVWILLMVLPGAEGENRYGRTPGSEHGHELRA